MKFLATLFVSGAVASSLGTPVVKKASVVQRDAATITSAISSISDATTKLGTSVQGFTGTGQVADLQSVSQALIDTLKSSTTAVEATAELSQTDALALTTPVQDLGTLVKSTVDAAIAKKDTFVSAGIGSVVLDQLTQQRDAAKVFSDAVTSKVPAALQSIAASLAAPINQALDDGVTAFQDQSGSGGSSTSAVASASSSASASASSASASSVSASAPVATVSTPSGTAPSAPGTTGTGSGAGTNGTSTFTTTSLPTPSEFTGAAAPTAIAGYGAVALAAIAVAAAL